MDLGYAGPHAILLPLGEKWLVDFAWILRRLNDLFYGLSISDNNFKGDALEKAVRTEVGPIPHTELKASDGSSKQIDASFAVGNRLFIAECRVKAQSIAFARGDIDSIRQRNQFVENILADADDKAKWLTKNPIGRNYRVDQFSEIVPLGVSAEVEFIPGMNGWFWLRQGVPRVLTPDELKAELAQTSDTVTYSNSFKRGMST